MLTNFITIDNNYIDDFTCNFFLLKKRNILINILDNIKDKIESVFICNSGFIF